MVSLSTPGRILRALEDARNVTLGAYLLPRGRLRDALENAARRGATVHVRLEGEPYGSGKCGIANLNKQAVEELRGSGVDAKLVCDEESGLHIKAAIIDGAAYLDDRNFASNGPQTIVRDDSPRDVTRIQNAILYDDARPGRFLATLQSDGLRAESALIRKARAGDTIEVQSEFFGATPVSSALRAAAHRGVRCKLEVSNEHKIKPYERAILKSVAADGVEVRIGKCAEKFAVLNGTRAWLGSANATYDPKPQRDWGIRTNDAHIARAVRRNFTAAWRGAKALA